MIYLDHAATCAMRPKALEVMTAELKEDYGNPSASYPPAQRAKASLDRSRAALAATVGADWREIFFTSGGTEGDNWALTGAASVYPDTKGTIIVSAVEHHAILHTCAYLENLGFHVAYLGTDREGLVDPKELDSLLDENPDTFLVSVMLANNEVGTVEPVKELVRVVRAHQNDRILFHTDAVQAYGKIPIDVHDLGVDLLSVSAHKLGGPKGIGFLYIRKGVQLGALIHGGAQEMGRRAGTENVPAAAGFAAAADEAVALMEEEQKREAELQEYFLAELGKALPRPAWILNGPRPGENRLSSNINISFPGLDQRAILMNLDLAGICASGGSACTTGALDPSHVLMAMTEDERIARGAVRFTLGPENTREEIDRTVKVLKETVERLAGR